MEWQARMHVSRARRKIYNYASAYNIKSGEEFIIYCDTSHHALGYVTMQKWRVINYGSRQLRPHKNNYPTPNPKSAALAFALKIWRLCLY